MMMEVRDPLPAGSRHIQVFYSVVEVHRDAVPEKRRVPLNNVGGRRIAQLPVGTDLLKFPIERVCLARVQGSPSCPMRSAAWTNLGSRPLGSTRSSGIGKRVISIAAATRAASRIGDFSNR